MLVGFWPTTGLAAINFPLQSQALRITMTAFSFDTSGHSYACQQNMSTAAEVQAWTDQIVVHRTRLEKEVFCQNREKNTVSQQSSSPRPDS